VGTVFGGEWAGWSVAIDTQTGHVKKIPEHLTPASLVKWGQVPLGFELISSERIYDGKFERRCIRLLPAVGCSNDNLFGNCFSSIFDEKALKGSNDLEIYTFDVSDGLGGYVNRFFFHRKEFRIRVTMTSNPTRATLGPVILIAKERRWNRVGDLCDIVASSQTGFYFHSVHDAKFKVGAVSQTGLDSRFVHDMINSKCFADEPSCRVGDMLRLPLGIQVRYQIDDKKNFTIEVSSRSATDGEVTVRWRYSLLGFSVEYERTLGDDEHILK
jgi:hypothetical protein